jgi:hypothetical protein
MQSSRLSLRVYYTINSLKTGNHGGVISTGLDGKMGREPHRSELKSYTPWRADTRQFYGGNKDLRSDSLWRTPGKPVKAG